jgi:hypothetical protein
VLVDEKLVLEVEVVAVEVLALGMRVGVDEMELEVVLVDHQLVLEVVVAVKEMVGVGVEEMAVGEDHKLVLEVEEVVVVGVELADRTVLPELVVAVRVRMFLQPGPGLFPVHQTREELAQQTLASRAARAQPT